MKLFNYTQYLTISALNRVLTNEAGVWNNEIIR